MKITQSYPIVVPAGSVSHVDDRLRASDQIRDFLPGYLPGPAAAVQTDALVVPEQAIISPIRRLVVVIPDGDIDESALAQRVWQLASTSVLSVLYLALSPDYAGVAYQRRRLAALASITSGEGVRALIQVVEGKSWPQALEGVLHTGDLLVCLQNHLVPFRLVGRRALGELLAGAFTVPVYVLGKLHVGPSPKRHLWLKEMLAWLASLGVMAAFFGVQVWIDQMSRKPASTVLLCFSLLVEVYFIWKVNEWIG